MVCLQCPRKCGINRQEHTGFCGASVLKIAKIMRHYGEEPIISGKNGSGTIFFSNCSLKCCYCQNFEISHEGYGKNFSIMDLVNIFKLLENEGLENINLVSPTHYTYEIIKALKIYKPKIPVVWNTSGYETEENIKLLQKYVDVFLCDFKYFDNELALKYSKAKDYFENCGAALKQMRKNQPVDQITNGIMLKGLIVRHLILPEHSGDSINVLRWINNNLGNKTYISLMSQYVPCYHANNYQEINRCLKPLEYQRVLHEMEKLGFENGFLQEQSSACTESIPNFNNDKLIEL